MTKIKHIPRKTLLVSVILAMILLAGAGLHFMTTNDTPTKVTSQPVTVDRATEDRWKKILTPEQYNILREAGTEAPFTGALEHESHPGTYYSVGCDKPVFRSEQKYDSGTGWPSFFDPIKPDALVLRQESGPFDSRTEVLDTCGSHLGHVFDDGPQPTGKRYCMNSVALYFVPDEK